MKTIRIPYKGKAYSVTYKIETIDLSMTSLGFLNVYSVFIEDADLNKITGDHFTILHNSMQTIKPCFESSGNADEYNLKKEIAQQIMNNPGE